MSAELSGKTALITGARRGIGRAATRALAGAGADVIGVDASLADDDEFQSFRCDLGDRHALYELLGLLPDIDILVLNAGTIERKPAIDHGDEIWDRVLEVNLTAPFVLARELGRRMVERGQREDHFRCFGAFVPRRRERAELYREQVGHRGPDPGAG